MNTASPPSAAASAAGQPILPPGFRFHPTDEELIRYYLHRKAVGLPLPVPIIADIDLYKFDPWDLPGKASFGEHEWYFFSPRDRKYPNGSRPNRAAASGYWKATGTDKPIASSDGSGQKVGVKKALVFYRGRPPRGAKTDWIMHEYRLSGDFHASVRPTVTFSSRKSLRLDDWVLCRIYKKSASQSAAKLTEESSPSFPDYLSSMSDVGSEQKFPGLPKLGSFGALPDGDGFLDSILTDPDSLLGNSATSFQPQQLALDKQRGCGGPPLECDKHPSAMSPCFSCVPFSCGSYATFPKSECTGIADIVRDSSSLIGMYREEAESTIIKGSLLSLPSLIDKPLVQQQQKMLATTGDEVDAFYKWPLAARAN
ncbi:hypothetical protein KP509_32G060500 [Ceratopteris richardii]|uniref:NAC domain-containing protein n=1 Tax=Ceratopteris richardii TaxID=49495 RepID=A0A8T2QW12_CERRI|nr:hypothetical protein KP509_32G060500 [Ceratopteris richardii]